MLALKRRMSASSLNSTDIEAFLAVDQYKSNKNIMKELLEAGNEYQNAIKAKLNAHKKFLEVIAKLKLWLEIVRDDRYKRDCMKHEQLQTVSLGAEVPPPPIPDSKQVELVGEFLECELATIACEEEMQHKFNMLLLDPIPHILKKEVKLVPFLIDKYHQRNAEHQVLVGKLAKAKADNNAVKIEKYEQESKVASEKFEEAKNQLKAASAIVHGREEELVDRLCAYLHVQSEYYKPKMFRDMEPRVPQPNMGLYGAIPMSVLPEPLQKAELEQTELEASVANGDDNNNNGNEEQSNSDNDASSTVANVGVVVTASSSNENNENQAQSE